MPEEDFVELSQIHTSVNYPYPHVDAFIRDSVTGKKVREVGDGYPVY
ncbi:MAG: hypothetical protein ABSB71_08335 [Candidatus Bathyarchaeia archaeon]|jgi:hypothetical protein